METSSSKKRPAPEDLDQHQPPHKKPSIVYREPSIFGTKPVDDVTRYIANFIAQHVNQENVEIEAKLGVFVEKRSGQRIDIGAETETIIHQDYLRTHRFESNMHLIQHKAFNEMLNDRVNRSQAKEYRGERVQYKHTNEIDKFYDIPGSRNKYRVSTDQKTGKIVENGIVEKVRVADLNIHSPNEVLDFRISINIENPREKPTTQAVYERIKDRISYKHGGIAFDLTQVKTEVDQDPAKDPKVRHEMELEFADSRFLCQEKLKQDRREPSQYNQLVEVFVNNIRLLCRNLKEKTRS